MDILSDPLQVFSLPPEILSVITLRQNSTKIISEPEKLIPEPERTITDLKEINVLTKQDENDSIKLTCLVCGITSFESVKQQRDHHKLDWHRFNVKRRAIGLKLGKSHYKPTTEEKFEELMESMDGRLEQNYLKKIVFFLNITNYHYHYQITSQVFQVQHRYTLIQKMT